MFNFNVNRDSRILNQVQEKLMTNNVIVTKARKDNSIIIIKEEEYGNKINPINAELNPICHLMVLLRAHPILYISRIRVNALQNKLLMLKPTVSSKLNIQKI